MSVSRLEQPSRPDEQGVKCHFYSPHLSVTAALTYTLPSSSQGLQVPGTGSGKVALLSLCKKQQWYHHPGLSPGRLCPLILNLHTALATASTEPPFMFLTDCNIVVTLQPLAGPPTFTGPHWSGR